MYKTKSPMRFDLAGGTLDLWPIWAMLKQATTVNVSLSLYSHCELTPLAGKEIHIESEDFKKKWNFSNLQDFLKSPDKDLSFYQAHVSHWNPTEGFKLSTRSESPVGGGLGGSSSLSISVYKAFMQWRGLNEDLHQIVRACSNIEAYILKTPTGTQDYYGAISVGLNIIDFNFSGTSLHKITNHVEDLEKKLIIVYTGKSHHSGINNWQVLKNYIDGDTTTHRALKDIQQVSSEMKSVCLAADWKKIPELFAREYQARLLLADSFVSPEILKLKQIADSSGCEGFKICGAGGGGCVGLWVDPERVKIIKSKVQAEGFQVLDVTLL